MTRFAGFDIEVPPLFAIPALLGALALTAILFGRLAKRLAVTWFDGAPEGAHGDGAEPPPRVALQITLAIFAAGLLLLSPEFALLGRHARAARVAVTVLLVASAAVVVTRVAVAAVTAYARRRPALAPARSVARMAVRIAIAILAVLTGLQALGVPVTPLLTTLGIGSLAVALALQDTLANFFAGLYLLADRPVRPGDYIKLSESGAEGYVDSIGWRSSRLRTLAGNIVIVPNQKVSQTILTNFHLPQAELVLTIPVTVPYEVELESVERCLGEELARAAKDLPEIVTPEPLLRLTELGLQGMVWTCIVRVRDFDAQGKVGHELRRRIVARLKHEHIDFSYPQEVVHDAPVRQRPARPA